MNRVKQNLDPVLKKNTHYCTKNKFSKRDYSKRVASSAAV